MVGAAGEVARRAPLCARARAPSGRVGSGLAGGRGPARLASPSAGLPAPSRVAQSHLTGRAPIGGSAADPRPLQCVAVPRAVTALAAGGVEPPGMGAALADGRPDRGPDLPPQPVEI